MMSDYEDQVTTKSSKNTRKRRAELSAIFNVAAHRPDASFPSKDKTPAEIHDEAVRRGYMPCEVAQLPNVDVPDGWIRNWGMWRYEPPKVDTLAGWEFNGANFKRVE